LDSFNCLFNESKNCVNCFEQFEETVVKCLNEVAPKKTKILRGYDKPHVSKNLRKAIMKRSELKNKANKSKNLEDIDQFKKQRNLVTKINKREKKDFLNNLSTTTNSKPFWDICKPYFSNKGNKRSANITLLHNDKMLDDGDEVSKVFNSYYNTLWYWPENQNMSLSDPILEITEKYKNHPSIKNIKSSVKVSSSLHSWLICSVRSTTYITDFVDRYFMDCGSLDHWIIGSWIIRSWIVDH